MLFNQGAAAGTQVSCSSSQDRHRSATTSSGPPFDGPAARPSATSACLIHRRNELTVILKSDASPSNVAFERRETVATSRLKYGGNLLAMIDIPPWTTPTLDVNQT
jgi:hypothetical protein